MKIRFLALVLLPAAAFAQDEAPPIQMPSNLFFETDFIVSVPKDTLSIGVRTLSGAHATFRGNGNLESTQLNGDFATKDIARGYHDGAVNRDARVRGVDDGTGNVTNVPIAPDGKTNNWQMLESSQITANGTITMSTYQAAVLDGGLKSKDPKTAYGPELQLRHDLVTRAKFNITMLGGVSLNGISSKISSFEDARVTKVSDTFSLDGTPAPSAPYPNSPISTPVVDANGFPVIGEDGNAATTPVDTIVLLVTDPLSRETTTEVKPGAVANNFTLRGAYFTFRAGPSFQVPLSRRLQATVSAGAAVVFAGTSYTVQQNFEPETGQVITDSVTSNKNILLPGFYADASLELILTERAGFYVGAVFQSTGDYKQNVGAATADYTTHVDLKSLGGLNMGMNVRF